MSDDRGVDGAMLVELKNLKRQKNGPNCGFISQKMILTQQHAMSEAVLSKYQEYRTLSWRG